MREELIRVVRNGKMSCEMSWRREEGIRSREQVMACALVCEHLQRREG